MNGDGQLDLEQHHSGLETNTTEGRKPITEVINVFELQGDDIRAQLIRSIREAVMEARKAREAAKQYLRRNGRS